MAAIKSVFTLVFALIRLTESLTNGQLKKNGQMRYKDSITIWCLCVTLLVIVLCVFSLQKPIPKGEAQTEAHSSKQDVKKDV